MLQMSLPTTAPKFNNSPKTQLSGGRVPVSLSIKINIDHHDIKQ